MEKKNYRKPELKTRKIELGVFGSYNNSNPVPTGTTPRTPLDDRDNFNYHME